MTAAPTRLAARERKRPEHRRVQRREVLASGLLIHGRSSLTVPCVIRDVSPIGARVKLKSPEILSRPLHLVIGKTGAAFEADVAWAKDSELGLEFKARLNLADPKRDIEKTAWRLWQAMPRR